MIIHNLTIPSDIQRWKVMYKERGNLEIFRKEALNLVLLFRSAFALLDGVPQYVCKEKNNNDITGNKLLIDKRMHI